MIDNAVVVGQRTADAYGVFVCVFSNSEVEGGASTIIETCHGLAVAVAEDQGRGNHAHSVDVVDLSLRCSVFTRKICGEGFNALMVAFREMAEVFRDGESTFFCPSSTAVERCCICSSVDAILSVLMAVGVGEIGNDVPCWLVDAPG